jgi:hypothetical protein
VHGLIQERVDIALDAQAKLIAALDLGGRQPVAGGIGSSVVDAVDLPRLIRRRRDHDEQVAPGGAGNVDRLGAYVHRRVRDAPGDLVHPLLQAVEVDRGELRRDGFVAVVHADDQHAPVNGELGEVLGQLLVRAPAGRQRALEVEGVPLLEDPLVQGILEVGFVVGKPDHVAVLSFGCGRRAARRTIGRFSGPQARTTETHSMANQDSTASAGALGARRRAARGAPARPSTARDQLNARSVSNMTMAV